MQKVRFFQIDPCKARINLCSIIIIALQIIGIYFVKQLESEFKNEFPRFYSTKN